jgi:hypothetical protein
MAQPGVGSAWLFAFLTIKQHRECDAIEDFSGYRGEIGSGSRV